MINHAIISCWTYCQYPIDCFRVHDQCGTFDQLSTKLPAAALTQLENILLQVTPLLSTLGELERIFATIAHIFFSLLVLYGIVNRKKIFLLLAILAHAFMDLSPGLYQVHVVTNIWMIEFLLMFFAVVALLQILRFKKTVGKLELTKNKGLGKPQAFLFKESIFCCCLPFIFTLK